MLTSPASAALLLALLSLGAKGATLDELHDAIYTRSHDDTKNRYGDLINALTSAGLTFANKVYYMNGYSIGVDFEYDALNIFNSEVEPIDFSNDVAAVNTINAWVESKTDNLIKDAIKTVDKDTKVLLVNAMYFKANWEKQFKTSDTKADQPFNLLDGTTQGTTMMNQDEFFLYGTIPSLDATAAEMFYAGGDLSMVIVRPNTIKGLPTLERKLQENTNWNSLLSGMKSTFIRLSVPRLRPGSTLDINKILQNLDVQLIFDPINSELNPLLQNYNDPLHVSVARLASYIDISEVGSFGAGGAVGSVRRAKLPTRAPTPFLVDRPFLFIVRDKLGHIIMMGTYKGYHPK